MITRIFSAPAFHFVLLGALLFVVHEVWWEPADDRDSSAGTPHRPIVVAELVLAELRNDFAKTIGRPATASEENGMIRDYADREMLYREALARGLDRDDRSIKWRLVQKMRFLEGRESDDPEALYREALELGLDRDDLVIRRLLIEKMRLLIKVNAGGEAPAEEVLRDYFLKNAEDYRQPARVSLQHVFFSTDKRGQRAAADAASELERLVVESTSASDAISLGDVFALGHHLRGNSRHNLAKLLGPDFAGAAIAVQPGSWHGPIRSAYGFHLVWVDERHESALPELDAVRNQVELRYLAERRERELQKAIERMRQRYAVVVAGVELRG